MRRQQEAQAAWEAEGEVAERYNPDNDESDEDDDEETKMEKRKRREIRDACDYEDQYDSCGEDVETELERGQRVGNVVIDDGPEDVSFSLFSPVILRSIFHGLLGAIANVWLW